MPIVAGGSRRGRVRSLPFATVCALLDIAVSEPIDGKPVLQILRPPAAPAPAAR